jgi:hypothetical protein
VHVFGHEHYAEHLEDLACAAVPIRHPISGKAVGAVNLTCWRKDAGRLLIALAQSTAAQVTQGLLNDSSAEEFQLLREYLRACRSTGGFVFALTHDMVLMNDQARDTLDPGDQAALLGHAAGALGGDHRVVVDVELPADRRRRGACEADRAGQPGSGGCGGRLAAAQVRTRPGGLRSAVAARLPSGGGGLRRG